MEKCFFTYATGKKYLDLAFTLARSYRFHNGVEIPFCIVSDETVNLPSDLKWVDTTLISSAQKGSGLEFKLSFDQIPDAQKAIFIDADSIVYGNISSLFEEIPNTSVTVIGIPIKKGTWVDINTEEAMAKYSIPYLIRYCGAFYYIVKGKLTEEIYSFARDLLKEKNSFHQHHFGVNEEPLMSISLAKHSVEPFPDSGNIWTDLVQWDIQQPLNVFKGKPRFHNNPGTKNFKFWLPAGDYTPSIIHIGGGNHNKNPWLFDSLRLKLYYQYKLPQYLANLLVTCAARPSYFALKKLKQKIEKAN